nr:hypothetical protein BaRGS_024618 [Batillaria attramentaria]
MKRWKNLRTDYGKLRKVLGKSGQGAKKMSSLQQWKLMALAFLDKHIQRRGSGQIGRGAEEEDMDEVSSNDDTESVASMSMWPSSVKRERCRSRSPTTSSGVEVKKKKIEKQQQQRDVSEVLVDILEYNRKKDLEVEKKVRDERCSAWKSLDTKLLVRLDSAASASSTSDKERLGPTTFCNEDKNRLHENLMQNQ